MAQALPGTLTSRLHSRAAAGRWSVTHERFAEALAASAARAFPSDSPDPREVEAYLSRLHLEDLALACACADGHEGAWEHFIREYRPGLYRAAAAVDPAGGAREIADSLYAELYGLRERQGARQSLLRYFHGRSSLATWLRAVLAQRHVDRVRAERRLEPLPDEETAPPPASVQPDPAFERATWSTTLAQALAAAVDRLPQRDRLRLACYYAHGLTLAAIGRTLHEHEATVSRHLARTRRTIREDVERELRARGMNDASLAECFAAAVEDAGALDLAEVLGPAEARKEPGRARST